MDLKNLTSPLSTDRGCISRVFRRLNIHLLFLQTRLRWRNQVKKILAIVVVLVSVLPNLIVWFWVKETTITIARGELHKEKLKLKREQLRKERATIAATTIEEKQRLEHETLDKKLKYRIAKKIVDAL